ncbi:Cyclin-like F-box [Fusarium austroafricanum]|uniref:Cyclin-like F-box n=1 Tax=Fusarium austroafricanum TaxID=2364996 RepID=A0A8H4KUG2_9HYPO|nr:Cyclin-like F-box [Fusarium austroafricanum]
MSESELVPPPYRSNSRYEYDEDQAHHIIRVVSYVRIGKDFLPHVVRFPCHENDKCIAGFTAGYVAQERQVDRNGLFDKLPGQVLNQMVSYCDMKSVFNLRQTHHWTRRRINKMEMYRKIVSHGVDLCRVLLRTGFASNVILGNFYRELRTKSCESCGQFAQLVCITTFRRICCNCIESANHIKFLEVTTVQSWLDPSEYLSPWYPTVTGLDREGTRTRLVPYHLVEDLDRETRKRKRVIFRRRKPHVFIKPNYMVTCLLPYLDLNPRFLQYALHYGFACRGCKDAGKRCDIAKELRDEKLEKRVYDTEEFLKHFRWCEKAQEIWERPRLRPVSRAVTTSESESGSEGEGQDESRLLPAPESRSETAGHEDIDYPGPQSLFELPPEQRRSPPRPVEPGHFPPLELPRDTRPLPRLTPEPGPPTEQISLPPLILEPSLSPRPGLKWVRPLLSQDSLPGEERQATHHPRPQPGLPHRPNPECLPAWRFLTQEEQDAVQSERDHEESTHRPALDYLSALASGHLRHALPDVPPQRNALPDQVSYLAQYALSLIRPRTLPPVDDGQEHEAAPQARDPDFEALPADRWLSRPSRPWEL